MQLKSGGVCQLSVVSCHCQLLVGESNPVGASTRRAREGEASAFTVFEALKPVTLGATLRGVVVGVAAGKALPCGSRLNHKGFIRANSVQRR